MDRDDPQTLDKPAEPFHDRVILRLMLARLTLGKINVFGTPSHAARWASASENHYTCFMGVHGHEHSTAIGV
jgi:hypothetical protein